MCQSAVVWTGIETVVFGSSIHFLQSRGWWQIDISVMAGVGQTSIDL
jgi:tRNA(adenine34) deaminase